MATPVAGVRPTELPEDDDKALVAAVRRGDDQAFERLYARYHRRISAYIRGMVKDYARSEDITQEVFISALRRLRNTDQEITLKPWLYEIARNACIDQYRRTQRAPEVVLDTDAPESEPLVSFGPTPDVAMDTKQTLEDLRHAFSGLSGVQHQILVMRELEGRSYREIGERLNLTRPAVESALFRARRRLLEEYEELSSGARCMRVQRAINSACTGSPGVRERWRIASHVSHCGVCRRHAHMSGLGPELMTTSVPARVAAVLPLPAFLRRLVLTRGAPRIGTVHPDHLSGVANMAGAVGSAAEPLSAWITAGAAAATVALAIGGASVIGSSSPHRAPVTPRRVAAATRPGATTGGSGARSRSAAAGAGSGSLQTPSAGGAVHSRRVSSSSPSGSAPTSTGQAQPTKAAHSAPASQPRRSGASSQSRLGLLPSSPGSSSQGSAPALADVTHPHIRQTVSAATQGAGAATGVSPSASHALTPAQANLPTTSATQTVTKAVQGLTGSSTQQGAPAVPKP